jgi:heme O synthase-like polyprenyltransferase
MATRGLLSANILNGYRRADLPMNSVPDRTSVSRKQGVCMLLILLRLLVLPVPVGTNLFAEIIYLQK